MTGIVTWSIVLPVPDAAVKKSVNLSTPMTKTGLESYTGA